MHVPFFLSSRQLCLYPTACRGPRACSPSIAHPVQDTQRRGYHDSARIDGYDGDFGGDVPILVNILSRLRIGVDALRGVPCLESLWPDNVGDTECRGNEGASCHLSWYQYWSFHRFMMDGDTFIVYPLKFAPVQAKINANGATVCHHEHHSYLIARTIVPTEIRTIFTK